MGELEGDASVLTTLFEHNAWANLPRYYWSAAAQRPWNDSQCRAVRSGG